MESFNFNITIKFIQAKRIFITVYNLHILKGLLSILSVLYKIIGNIKRNNEWKVMYSPYESLRLSWGIKCIVKR